MIRDILYYFITLDNLKIIIENDILYRSKDVVKVSSVDLKRQLKKDELQGIIPFTNLPKLEDNNSDTIRIIFERHKLLKKYRLYKNLNTNIKGNHFIIIEDIENVSNLITQINVLDFSSNISELKKISKMENFFKFLIKVVKKFIKF